MTPVAALVLTAGLGTRLRPLTYARAKAAVPVNGEPLVRRVSRWLARCGITDQVFNLHHQAASIAHILGDGGGLGVRVRYSWEQPILGSAGGPRRALPLVTGQGRTRFLIVNGDTLTDVDLPALLARHEESGAQVTMALVPNPAPDRYGGVAITDDSFVHGFTRAGAVPESYHFIGVQVAEARAFATLKEGVPYESVNALYPEMMRRSARAVGAFVSRATFRDIGTPGDCLRTSLLLSEEEGDHLVSRSATIAPTAVLERTAVWDDVTVDRGVHLADCIVADGVHIREGSVFERCAIVPAGVRAPAADERVEEGLLIRAL